MRWFWIDQFVEFESGSRAVAHKNVTLGEVHVSSYVPGQAVLPTSLIVEGFAQTGGILVAEANHFAHRVVLAKVSRASLVYTARLEQIQDDGAIVSADARVAQGDELVAEAKLVFAHLGQEIAESLFDPQELWRLLQLWKLYEVGQGPDGLPLKVPQLFPQVDLERSASML